MRVAERDIIIARSKIIFITLFVQLLLFIYIMNTSILTEIKYCIYPDQHINLSKIIYNRHIQYLRVNLFAKPNFLDHLQIFLVLPLHSTKSRH